MIGSEQVREEEGEIVANHLLFFVDPDFLAQDADSAGTSKIRFIVGHFAQADLSAYEEIFAQMMRIAQHLQTDSQAIISFKTRPPQKNRPPFLAGAKLPWFSRLSRA